MKNNNLDIGKLRHRIKLIDFAQEENELGALVKVEKVIKTIWARVEHKQGKEISLDDKIKNTETLLIKIRYFKDINSNMIVEFKGNKYYITKIDNYRFLNKEMNLEVVSHRN